jgi:hypothetical protein
MISLGSYILINGVRSLLRDIAMNLNEHGDTCLTVVISTIQEKVRWPEY